MKLLRAMTTILIRQTKETIGEIMIPFVSIAVFAGIIWFISDFLGLIGEELCKFLIESWVVLIFVLVFIMSVRNTITEVTKEYRGNNR